MAKVMKSYRMDETDLRIISFIREEIAKHPDYFHLYSMDLDSDSEVISRALVVLLLHLDDLSKDDPELEAEFKKFKGPKTI